MRKMIALSLIFLASATTAETKGEFSLCEALSIYAHNAMASRQAGIPIREVIKETAERLDKAVKDDPSAAGPGGAIRDIADSIVEDAYSRPVFSEDGLQKRMIADFENEWYMACYKAGKD